MRIHVLIETLSVAKTMMYNVPHLIDEDSLSNLGSAAEKLEESLKIDCKAIFEGINGETCNNVNLLNLDLVFKIGLPMFFLGSASVIDHLDVEEDINQISSDTKQPVELIFQLVRNYKAIPHAVASYKIERPDFELNRFGSLSAELIKEYKLTRVHTTLDESLCHGYFFNFLTRPRSPENNHYLMHLETVLNQFAHVNVLFTLLPKVVNDFDQEHPT